MKKTLKAVKPAKMQCCSTSESAGPPNHEKQIHRTRRIRGQLQGIEKMIEERRYCPDIIVQVQAIRSALSSLESKLLEEHLHNCVKQAFLSGDDKKKDEKIEEILHLVRRS